MLTSFTNRVNTLLLVLLVMMAAAIIAVLANRASAGPLDPPGPPASTMHTLGDTPPSWDQVLDSTNGAPGPANPPAGCNSDRFKCVMNYSQCGGVCITVYPAVLDGETGLVWQRAVDTTLGTGDYTEAIEACGNENTARVKGWRLPTLAEAMSLIDPVVSASPPHLVAGNPFTNVPTTGTIWTSTEELDYATSAFTVDLNLGVPSFSPKNGSWYIWCVRGATSKE